MKQFIGVLLLCCLCFFLGSSHRFEQEYQYERTNGAFTDLIKPGTQPLGTPSKHFLCGFQLERRVWSITVNNCRCKRVFFRTRCSPCQHKFNTQRGGVKLIFCSYTNWTSQIVRQFTTGGNQGWNNPVMCPAGYFANGFASRYLQDRGDRGMVGLRLRCSTNTLSQTVTVEDGAPNTVELVGTPGLFISTGKIKYHQGKIIGVRFGFESMPVISKIEIKYPLVMDLNITPLVIDSVEISNGGSLASQQVVKLDKDYSVVNIWRQSNSFTRGYEYSSTLSVSSPKFFGGGVDQSSTNKLYSSRAQSFQLGKQLKTTFSSGKKVTVFVPSCTRLTIKTLVRDQRGDLPFTAKITFANRQTNEPIAEQTVQGIWSGSIFSEISTKIQETPILGCNKASSNLRT